MVKTHPNLRNFFYLLSSGLLIHFMGTIYRIWLARKIGAESLGIFQMAYPVYRLLSGIAAIGLPMALTKWVAEYTTNGELNKIQALQNWAVKTVFTCSLIASGILLFTAVPLSTVVFAEPRVKSAFYVLVPAIPFSALSAIYRGYFQGFSLMTPNAVSELTEQIAEISFTCLALLFWFDRFPNGRHIFPIIGLTIGEIASLGTLIYYYHSRSSSIPEFSENTNIPYLQIFGFAWPLFLNQIVVAIGMSTEASLIPRLLNNTYGSSNESTRRFGMLNGMAAPVAYFPLIFLLPLATVLSPQVSSALKNNSLRSMALKLRRYYTLGLLLCTLGWLIVFFQAIPLSRLLYRTLQPVSQIQILALGLPFAGLGILNLTILGAAGFSQKILLLSLWAIGLKTALFFILIPHLGINGAAWAITITQIFIFLASLFEMQPYLTHFSAKNFPKWLQLFRFLKVRR